MAALEREADSAAEAAVAGRSAIVRTVAAPAMQASLLDDMQARVGGGLSAVADWVLGQPDAAGYPLLRELAGLRRQVQSLTEVAVSAEDAAALEASYLDLRDGLPSWIPVPALSFTGPPVQAAGALAIPAGVIILLILLAILIVWYLGNLDPRTRRQRERAVEEILERLRPRRPEVKREPEKKPDPDPEKKPDDRPPPLGPDIAPDQDETNRTEPTSDPLPISWRRSCRIPTLSSVLWNGPSRLAREILRPGASCCCRPGHATTTTPTPMPRRRPSPSSALPRRAGGGGNLCALRADLHQVGHPRLDNQSEHLPVYLEYSICSPLLRMHPPYQTYEIVASK